jgi:hypothetical protein
MDPQIQSAKLWFQRIYLDGVPFLLRQNETAFLSFLCNVAAIDALASYRYATVASASVFAGSLRTTFRRSTGYTQRISIFSVAACSITFRPHASRWCTQLQRPTCGKAGIGDVVLDDRTSFVHMRSAAERYFEELEQSAALQADMLARLRNVDQGGSIGVDPSP